MLLRASGQREGKQYDLASVTDSHRESGVEYGHYLVQLTDAVIKYDWLALPRVRREAEMLLGEQAVVDALVVAAAFNGITRVADATGIPLDENTEKVTLEMRQLTGIEHFSYAAKSERYDPQ